MAARSPLRSRDFRRLWLGQTVSAAGDQIFPIAAHPGRRTALVPAQAVPVDRVPVA